MLLAIIAGDLGNTAAVLGNKAAVLGNITGVLGNKAAMLGNTPGTLGHMVAVSRSFHPCSRTNRAISCQISGEVYIALLISGVLLHNLYYQTQLIYQSSRGFYFETAPLLLKHIVY